jgi:hypothetical protein
MKRKNLLGAAAVVLIAAAYIGLAMQARAAAHNYRITITQPPQVCIASDISLDIGAPGAANTIDAVCHPGDWIFGDGFGQ